MVGKEPLNKDQVLLRLMRLNTLYRNQMEKATRLLYECKKNDDDTIKA